MLLASFAMHTMAAFGKMNSSAFEIEYTTNSLGKLYFESEKYPLADGETERSHGELNSSYWFCDLSRQQVAGDGT